MAVNFRIKPGVLDLTRKEHRMCSKKMQYETKKEADFVCDRQKKKAPGGHLLESYLCRWCGLWHIGHRGKDWKR